MQTHSKNSLADQEDNDLKKRIRKSSELLQEDNLLGRHNLLMQQSKRRNRRGVECSLVPLPPGGPQLHYAANKSAPL